MVKGDPFGQSRSFFSSLSLDLSRSSSPTLLHRWLGRCGCHLTIPRLHCIDNSCSYAAPSSCHGEVLACLPHCCFLESVLWLLVELGLFFINPCKLVCVSPHPFLCLLTRMVCSNFHVPSTFLPICIINKPLNR